MFNLSFGEIFFILILAVLLIKPNDIPAIIYNLKKAFKKFMGLKNEFLEEINNIQDDIKDLEEDVKKDKKND